ncbi:hypothetical protein [Chondromyces crocatus]|uniref:Uncharacterized protein n=1 Tax=Chondromyces crocatus TaxID=52 RepID=A0A0K1EG74_CHOCO|nr:hypothetical protein [Chondromyces crocatus]AKT39563.1 uncharacterized protein CMC5_037100 [Chondromyces crocatus]
MKYAEEREFDLHVVLRCEFAEDYEGDLDGYAWAEEVPRITAELVSAAVAALKRHPQWRVRGGNRGRPAEDEVMLIVERVLHERETAS